jgi:hypothetical protein
MMRTLVVVRPTTTTTTLHRLPTLHMIMMIEGPPPFWRLMPKGEWAHNLSVWGVYLHIYPSIYPCVMDMYELFVWWTLCGVMLGEVPRTLLKL